ncbi:unnamed protein product, partial [Meganyctiphanes norvegica]
MSSIQRDKTLNKMNMELYKACASGSYDDVQNLLQKGAKPMPRSATENNCPLYITCRSGLYSILELLLDNLESNDGLVSALQFVDKYGNSLFHILIKSIYKNKAKVDRFGIDYDKCMGTVLKYTKHEKYNEFTFFKEKEHNLLVDACQKGLNECVRRLLKENVDPTKYYKPGDNKFAIHIAGSRGYIEIFESLINKLKDLNKLEYGLQQKDKFGNSVLHAISKGLEKTMQSSRKQNKSHEDKINNYVKCLCVLLPEYKDYVDIDAVNNEGNTALHIAAVLQKCYNESRFVEFLCEHGASNDIKNKKGRYAGSHKIGFEGITDESKSAEGLYNACENGDLDQVKYYIEITEPTTVLRGKEGKSAICVAFSKGYYKIVDLLIKKMKKKIDLQQAIAIIKRFSQDNRKQITPSTEFDMVNNDVDYDKCLDILVENNQHCPNVLYAACKKGNVDIVSKLLSKGIDPTLPHDQNRKLSPIMVAFKNGHHYIADILLRKVNEMDKLQEVMGEDMVDSIIPHIVDGGLREKRKIIREVTKKEKNKGKVRSNTTNNKEGANYGKTMGVLIKHLENLDLKNKEEILYNACENGIPHFVQELIDLNVDPTRRCNDKMENYPLIIAARKGYSDILKIILSKLEENRLKLCLQQKTQRYGHSVLHVIMRRDKENTGTEEDYKKCMDILMKYRKYFDIDAKDNNGKTALHYAVHRQSDWIFAKTLIKNGACINVKNRQGIKVINRIPVNKIEDILNECIEENKFSDDRENENYTLKMDFSIFCHQESSDFRSESEFITALWDSHPHHHLLYHPLITTFVHMKWQKTKYSWYLNLFFNMIFFFLIFLYIFYYGKNLIINGIIDKDMELKILPLKITITILGAFLMIREIVQLTIFKWKYFNNTDNCLEVAILVLTAIMLYTRNIHMQHSIAAWLVVFSTMEIILLFEKMHLMEMAIYISMFKKVTYNFVKLTVLLSWAVLAFGASFYLLFHITSTEIGNPNIRENGFDTWRQAFLKTLVMSTGEMDYSDLDFHFFPSASRLLFVLFIFTIIFVAYNLLNGIAISDIQVIQNDASKYQIRDQVDSIINFDNLKPIYKLFGCINIWKKAQLLEECFPDKVIGPILPNRHYSTLYVRCKGHKDYHSIRFYFLRGYKWFKFLLNDIINFQFQRCYCNERQEIVQNKCKGCQQRAQKLRCSTCGEEKKICQKCSSKIQQKEHTCVYSHKFFIPSKFITISKQIKEKLETKENENNRKKPEEFQTKKLNHINIRITSIEK